jgi:hypothetical protein
LFLPGLALLQSPRTKRSIAWLEIFRPVTRHCHIWRTSRTLLKTSHPCDARWEDLKICTSPTLHRQFNHTAASPPTAIKILLKRESRSEDIDKYGQPWP